MPALNVVLITNYKMVIYDNRQTKQTHTALFNLHLQRQRTKCLTFYHFIANGGITGNLCLHRKEEEIPSFATSRKCCTNLCTTCEIDAHSANINHNEQIETPAKRHLDCCADMRPNWLPLVHYCYQAVAYEVELSSLSVCYGKLSRNLVKWLYMSYLMSVIDHVVYSNNFQRVLFLILQLRICHVRYLY